MNIKSIVVYALLSILFLTGCTTTTYSSPQDAIGLDSSISQGDKITLYMNNGETRVVRVNKVEGDTIYHTKGEVKFEDVGRVKVKRVSWAKSSAGIGGLVVAGVATFYILAHYVLPGLIVDRSE